MSSYYYLVSIGLHCSSHHIPRRVNSRCRAAPCLGVNVAHFPRALILYLEPLLCMEVNEEELWYQDKRSYFGVDLASLVSNGECKAGLRESWWLAVPTEGN